MPKRSSKQNKQLRKIEDLGMLERAKLLEKVAYYYYSTTERNSQENIAKKLKAEGLNVMGGYTVARLLDEAREQGVLWFDIDSSFGIVGNSVPHLSKELQIEFKLQRASVIEVNIQQDDKHSADDYLHTALANASGVNIGPRIDPQEVVAVGGGRAVNQCVRRIRRLKRDSPQEAQIIPLCGRIWTHYWKVRGPNIERPLDADDAAFVLALAFDAPGTRFSQVTHPLFASSSEEARKIMKEHCPFSPEGIWRWDKPRTALIGVGVVDPDSGHRIVDLYKENQQQVEMDQYLNKVAGELKNAIDSCGPDKGLPFFGDVTNRLFPSLPLPHEMNVDKLGSYDKSYKSLIEKLHDLNEKMIVVTWDQLRSIKHRVVIAGGPFKVNAIWTLLICKLLQEQKGIITELYTDTECAKSLIYALRTYEDLDSKIQKWYEDMARKLF